MRYSPAGGDFSECVLCGSSRHLCISVPIPNSDGGSADMAICIMCAKRVARAYTRFVATVKSRSYAYWYKEREKLRKAGLSSGLEKADKLIHALPKR